MTSFAFVVGLWVNRWFFDVYQIFMKTTSPKASLQRLILSSKFTFWNLLFDTGGWLKLMYMYIVFYMVDKYSSTDEVTCRQTPRLLGRFLWFINPNMENISWFLFSSFQFLELKGFLKHQDYHVYTNQHFLSSWF